jgi:hypothetical protein
MKIAHFILIGYQTWSPQAILVSDWSISKQIFSSETASGRFQRRKLKKIGQSETRIACGGHVW